MSAVRSLTILKSFKIGDYISKHRGSKDFKGWGDATCGTQQSTCSILGLKELLNLGNDLYHIYYDAATSPRI